MVGSTPNHKSPSLISKCETARKVPLKDSPGNRNSVQIIYLNYIYLVNQPFSAAGISEDNAYGWKIVRKWTFGSEAKLRGQLWNFKNNLSAEGIILRYNSKPERGLFIFYNPPINFHVILLATLRHVV